MNRHIYHYCAMHQLASGSIEYTDGIAFLKKQIVDWDGYQHLKKQIAKDEIAPEKITITSLSFLGLEL